MLSVYTPEDHPWLDDPETTCLIFLAGSIENGTAPEWQNKAVTEIKTFYRDVSSVVPTDREDVTVYNPRIKNWDTSIKQSVDDPKLVAQVLWELKRLRRSHIIFFHFAAGTQSPISMLELGIALGSGTNVVVSVDPGFYRAANIQITCSEFGAPCYTNMDSALQSLRHMIVAALQ